MNTIRKTKTLFVKSRILANLGSVRRITMRMVTLD
jgi:hypothetical protein